jgi:hypothetical protein
VIVLPLSTLVWYGGLRSTPSSTRNFVLAYRRKNFFGRMFTRSVFVPASSNVRMLEVSAGPSQVTFSEECPV